LSMVSIPFRFLDIFPFQTSWMNKTMNATSNCTCM
jgi:hypothetical protein